MVITSIKTKRFQQECEALIEKLRESSNELVDEIGDKVRDSFYETMELNRKEAFTQLFILIYQHDTKALERDLLKCIVLQTEDFQPSPKERVNLMRWLWSSVQYIYKDFDYSELLDKVRELNQLHETMASYGEDLPFV